MGVAVKRLRIGRRRPQAVESSPLELARAPAVIDGKWKVPDRFNFTRDVVEVLGADRKRQALTFVGPDTVIEPRTFADIAEGANRWAFVLRQRGIGPGDRVLVVSGITVDSVEALLGCIKVGAIAVPCPPTLPASALEARVSVSGAALVVAGDEAKGDIAQMSFAPEVVHVFEGRRRRSTDLVEPEPTESTSSNDVAVIAWTAGTSGSPKPVALTHGWTFAARCHAEHWLDAGPGDVVWCTARGSSAQGLAGTLFGPWARGAEVVLQEGAFDPMERLELIHRFQTTILCQTPAEYRALAERRELPRFRSGRLRRLLATGDHLPSDVVAAFEEAWGATIADGYGQSETGVVVGHPPPPKRRAGAEDELKGASDAEAEAYAEAPPGSLGVPLAGHHVAVVDEQGSEVPAGVEGTLAIRGRPPTLFAGYWDSPDETRAVFRGDWYLTGDVAVAEEDGSLWLVARAEDVIASRGRTFGPFDVERVLQAHPAVAESAVVGIRDLERGGHFVRAFVVLAPGVDASEQLEAELRQFVSESVLEHQVPREIEFTHELSRSASGALRRGELRERPVTARPLWENSDAPEPEPAPPAAEPLTPVGYVEPVVEPAESFPAPVAHIEDAVVPQAVVEPTFVVEPVPEIVLEPVPEIVVEPVPEPVVEPVPEPVVEPVPEPVVEPVPEQVVEAVPAPPVHEVESSAPVPLEPVVEPTFVVEPEPVVEPQGLVEPTPASATEVVELGTPASEVSDAPAADGAADLVGPAETEVSPTVGPEEPVEPVVVVVPDPEPVVVSISEPLPDYVVDPEQSAQPEQEPEQEPEPEAPDEEPEEHLGPLPEYIVDPQRRLEAVPVADPPVDAEPIASPPEPDEPRSAFPSAPVLDLGAAIERAASDDTERERRSAPRRPASSPAAEGKTKRGNSAAEPGDEPVETGWMRGLSSRLSAYSLGSSADEDDAHDADEDSQRD
jgi:acyl-coenzyme A synthetase/AMP-(fatty) acid ligase